MRDFSSCNVKKKVSHRCGVVIFNKDLDKIVLVLNRYSSEVLNKPKWGLPKGHINKSENEDYLKCAEREALEETGLKIKMDRKNGKIIIKKTNYYPICLDSEYLLSPEDDYEISEARWVSLSDIKDYTLNFECKQVVNKINRFKNLAKLNNASIY